MNDAKPTTGINETVTLTDNTTGESIELPILGGSVGPRAIDVSKLYGQTGMFTYDPGFTSTASCESAITYIDGDEGILLHRGYPIEQLAEHGDFLEVCYLLLYGELPTKAQKEDFDYREVRVAQAIIEQSRQVYLAADHSKFGRSAMVRLGSMAQIDALFTDRAPPASMRAMLAAAVAVPTAPAMEPAPAAGTTARSPNVGSQATAPSPRRTRRERGVDWIHSPAPSAAAMTRAGWLSSRIRNGHRNEDQTGMPWVQP